MGMEPWRNPGLPLHLRYIVCIDVAMCALAPMKNRIGLVYSWGYNLWKKK